MCTPHALTLHTYLFNTHSPPPTSRASHSHTHTPVPETWETWGWGQPWADMLDPSRNPGEIPGTDHLAACQKPRPLSLGWGSEVSRAWGRCGGQAGPALHSLPWPRDVGVPEPFSCPEIPVGEGRAARAPPLWLCGLGWLPSFWGSVSSSGDWVVGSRALCLHIHTSAASRHLLHFAGGLAPPLQPPRKGAGGR